jgi:hypothetical protein
MRTTESSICQSAAAIARGQALVSLPFSIEPELKVRSFQNSSKQVFRSKSKQSLDFQDTGKRDEDHHTQELKNLEACQVHGLCFGESLKQQEQDFVSVLLESSVE